MRQREKLTLTRLTAKSLFIKSSCSGKEKPGMRKDYGLNDPAPPNPHNPFKQEVAHGAYDEDGCEDIKIGNSSNTY